MEKDEMQVVIREELEQFKAALPQYASKEDLDTQLETIEQRVKDNNVKEDLTELKEAVEAQGLKLREMAENKSKAILKTALKAFEENKEDLALLKAGKITGVKMTGIQKATVLGSDIGSDSAGTYLPGAARMPNRMPFLKELFNQAPVGEDGHSTIYYTDQTTDTKSAAAFDEGAAVESSSDIVWTMASLDIENVGSSIKVSQRAIENIAFLASEVDFFLRKNVDLASDVYLYSGTGSSQPYGVTARATAYAAGAFATSYQDANLMDLIRVCSVLNSTDSPYISNYALLNLIDAEKYLYAKKDLNNNYIIPQNGSIIALVGGVNIIVNSGVTAGTLVVGDFSMGTIYQQKGLTVELGFIDDDFAKHLLTMKAYEEFNLLIRSAHQKAFRYVSDISAAIAGLLEPSA